MNIDEMKKSAINMVNVNDSIKAPLLKLNVKVNSTTTIPNSNEIEIYVDKSSTPTEERKTYSFSFSSPLAINDEFIIEPSINNNDIGMLTYVSRGGGIVKEYIKSEEIVLFVGANYISTNYTNAEISIIYPKNIDLVNYFLNTSLYSTISAKKQLTLDDIYFKDCFTEVDGEINASFKALTVGCISSKSGNFRLDSSGNLQVKSIIVDDKLEEENTIDFDQIYPVGSIYMSVINTNPGTYFGGSWELWGPGRVPVCVDGGDGDFNAPNKTGGEKYHTLSEAEMPSHKHATRGQWKIQGASGNASRCVAYQDISSDPIQYGSAIMNTGGSQPHNNIQPYITCYMWRRIA